MKFEKVYTIIMVISILVMILLVFVFIKAMNQAPKSCPVPKEVGRCDCVYNALGDKSLRYCNCYPGNVFIPGDKLIEGSNVTS